MKIADLKKSGAFVDEKGEKREIEWRGNKGEVHILRVSFGKIAATQSMPENERNVELVRLCARFGENGKEQLTREQAESLEPALAVALLNEIAEVNALGDAANDPNS